MTALPNITRHRIVFGLAGFSGAGKTTLAETLIRYFAEQKGLNVASIKHAHHDFDPDQPGKDSWRHRKAGARQMVISSARRRVKFTETPDGDEADLNTLLGEISPADLVLIEGYKKIDFPKVEIYRASLGHPFIHETFPGVELIATDSPLQDCPLPQLDLNAPHAVAEAILSHWGGNPSGART